MKTAAQKTPVNTGQRLMRRTPTQFPNITRTAKVGKASQQKVLPEASDKEREFLEDRQYGKNVSDKTLEWYKQALATFSGCTTLPEYKQRIVELRQRGISPRSINSWVLAVNAYQHWLSNSPVPKCHAGCTHIKLSRMQVEKRIIQTFTSEHLRVLLSPRSEWVKRAEGNGDIHRGTLEYDLAVGLAEGVSAVRAQALAAVLLDTGMRVDEALHLEWRHVDFNNMLVHIELGKGRKGRLVPISLEGRKWLHSLRKGAAAEAYVFRTSTGSPLTIRNAQRDIARICKAAGITGIRCSPHTFRHTFAVNYMRRKGNLEYLRRILGHTSITITMRYLESLGAEDLQAVHDGLSPLANL